MEQLSYVFTILFMLLGPLKVIPAYAGLMRGADVGFKRAVALRGALLASALCAFVFLAGNSLLAKYRISLDAVRIAGGMILLISALKLIFSHAEAARLIDGKPSATQVAASPVTVPIIVSHAGVAAILLFLLHEQQVPGMTQAVAISLAVMMALDFLAMFFIDKIVKAKGLLMALGVLGSVLMFVQAALAIQMILVALKSLGVVQLP